MSSFYFRLKVAFTTGHHCPLLVHHIVHRHLIRMLESSPQIYRYILQNLTSYSGIQSALSRHEPPFFPATKTRGAKTGFGRKHIYIILFLFHLQLMSSLIFDSVLCVWPSDFQKKNPTMKNNFQGVSTR